MPSHVRHYVEKTSTQYAPACGSGLCATNAEGVVQLHSGAPFYGSVAQLNRASDYESEGCRFDSCRDYQLSMITHSHEQVMHTAIMVIMTFWASIGLNR